MGKIQTMAFGGGTIDSRDTDLDVLGTSGLVVHCKGHLYGNHLLYSCIRLYVREYSLWDTVWSNDTEYRRTGENQYIPICQCNDCDWHYQYCDGSSYWKAWWWK